MISFTYNPKHENIIIIFPYDPAAVMAVKELGAVPVYGNYPTGEKKFKHWELEINKKTIENLTAVKERADYQIDGMIFAAWEVKDERLKKNSILSRAVESDFILQPGYSYLQDKIPGFQLAAVEYMRLNPRGVILADEDYLDPKLETLLTIETGEMYPVLILCPIQNKFTWAGKLKRHFPKMRYEIWDENKAGVDELTRVCVVAYPHAAQVWESLACVNWRTLICDDIRHINDYNQARTKDILKLAEQTPLKIALSNGLDLKKPKNLISALMLTGRLNELGGFWHYVNKYCQAKQTPHGWDFSGASNLEELENRLRSLCLIARTKAQIKPMAPGF